MGYNGARNPIGTVSNAPLASAPGKELHPPILSTLEINGGQVKIDRERLYCVISNHPVTGSIMLMDFRFKFYFFPFLLMT